jgi:RNA binding exosome subunit
LKPPITSVEVTYLIHATEDERKVEEAVKSLLGMTPSFERDVLEGHFGNQIIKARAHMTGEAAASAFRHVIASLPLDVRRGAVMDLRAHIDEHSALYLRLDKQSLISGSPELGTKDAVRVKVKPRLYGLKGGAFELYAMELGRS